jgi:aryl-alcohol dehydrogenase-like predicted oxidoreductase
MGGGDVFKPGNPLDRVAKRHGASISQVALAWLLHRSPCILPIPGTSRVGHLEENTAAASLEISADEWKEIERSA